MIQDNCGVFGIAAKEGNVIDDLYLGTFYLQHRGQRYCGISTLKDGEIKIRTHKGLVRETFSNDLVGLEGKIGIGHASLKDRQPVLLNSKLGEFTICFSGFIINAEELIKEFKDQGHTLYSNSDVEVLGKLIALKDNFVDGIKHMASKIRGSYAMAILCKDGIYATRDKYGFRPLCLGQKDSIAAVASESCAFANSGIKLVRDVKAGEIVLLNEGKIESKGQIESTMKQYCAFEWVYIANLASVVDGMGVAQARNNIGAALYKRYPVEADIVAAVPNSGIGHAIGYSQASGIPFDNVFIKYDYASRSYTQPTQAERDREAKTKLIAVASAIKGKRVVICDDSIVRGTQFKNDLMVKLRNCGVKEVHARIACPPLKAPCQYGISTRSKAELAATNRTVEEIRQYIGLDSLGYATLEDLEQAIGKPLKDLCVSCWADEYKV